MEQAAPWQRWLRLALAQGWTWSVAKRLVFYRWLAVRDGRRYPSWEDRL